MAYIPDDLSSSALLNGALKYLEELQKGRVKPNTRGPGVINDSLDNIPDIEAVKEFINQMFGLDLEEIDAKRQQIKGYKHD